VIRQILKVEGIVGKHPEIFPFPRGGKNGRLLPKIRWLFKEVKGQSNFS
jgi:hypothetical protein